MEYPPKWKIVVLATLAMASSSTGFVSTNAHAPRLRRQSLYTSIAPIPTLEDMTVKELRQLLKDSNLQERGLLSKLKRKEDLVKYLEEHFLNARAADVRPVTTCSTDEDSSSQKERIRVAFPPLVSSERSSLETPTQLKNPLAGRDAFFDKIYEMYPSLRDDNCTRLGEDDVRQRHHLMLQNASTSDMDLIFVGTASCTPGLTRGVSCTALRLNWRRRYHPSDGEKVPEHTSFTGGTWIFDVGECTQVSNNNTAQGNHSTNQLLQMTKYRCWHQSETEF